MKKLVIAAASLTLFAQTAFGDDRYSMVALDGGTVRIDRQTGSVSFCRTVGGSLACTVAADERKAWEEENEALKNRLMALEKRLAALEPGGSMLKPDSSLSAQDEEQIDKAMRVAENVLRRFIGVVKDLKRDFETN